MPYLVTDPVPEEEADRYIVDIDGSLNQVPAELAGGMARLHHDVSGVSMGSHTAIVTAANMWGEGTPSDPFVFVKVLPSKVYGVGLEV